MPCKLVRTLPTLQVAVLDAILQHFWEADKMYTLDAYMALKQIVLTLSNVKVLLLSENSVAVFEKVDVKYQNLSK